LKQVEGEMPVRDLLRKHDYSDAMYYRWRSRLGGPYASEIRHLREFDSERAKSNRLRAEAMRAQTEISER
jgi:putative transposase